MPMNNANLKDRLSYLEVLAKIAEKEKMLVAMPAIYFE
jgi:hypothetical protein